MKTKTAVGISAGAGTAVLIYYTVLSPFLAGYVGLWAGHGECIAATNEATRDSNNDTKLKRAQAICDADSKRFIAIGNAATAASK